jgi:hypoxanthine phosphoribosyltransferase
MNPSDGSQQLTLLYSRTQIQQRVTELAKAIAADYPGPGLVVVGVLNGAVVFLADLLRAFRQDVRLGFVSVSSYGTSAESSGAPAIQIQSDLPVVGEDVLIVEDILDTGLSMTLLCQAIQARSPASLRICVLIDKRQRRLHAVKTDYVGFELSSGFVVGYGMDYAERYRSLPDIFSIDVTDPECGNDGDPKLG